MDFLQMALKFLIGGSVIVGATLLAKHVNPTLGGLIAVAPIITTLSIVFVYLETSAQETQQMVLGATYYIIPSAAFLVAAYYLFNRFGLVATIALSYVVWALVAVVVGKFVA